MPVQTYRLMNKVSIITINLTQIANHRAKHAVFFQLLFYSNNSVFYHPSSSLSPPFIRVKSLICIL